MQYLWYKFLRLTRIKKTMLADVPAFQWKMRVHVHEIVGKLIVRTGKWEKEYLDFLQKTQTWAMAMC